MRASRRIVMPLAVAVAGAVVIGVSPPASRDLLARAAMVLAGTWATWVLLGRLRVTTATRPERFDELRVRTAMAPTELPGLGAIEAALRMSMVHALGVEILLARLLRDVARWRLERNRNIDLELDPVAARRASGDALWRFIGPDALAPAATKRVASRELDAAIGDLERI